MPKPAPTLHHLSVSRTARYAQYGSLDAPTWWMVLHGYGQRAADFIAPFADLATADRCILAPEALSRFYTDGMASHQSVGASWMTREDRAHEIEDYVRYLDALAHRLQAERRADAAPAIHVLGFSQGAATASRWVALGTTPVEDLTLWAGDVAHDLDLEQHADAFRPLGVTVVLGDDDPYISDERFQALHARLDAHAIPVAVHRFSGGHRLHRATLRTLAAALG
jgi:predicted esterase